MIPSSFAYVRPETISDAISFLQRDGAVALAGGHTLMTELKHRLRRDKLVVDLNALPLTTIASDRHGMTIDAMVRQDMLMDAARGNALSLLADVGETAGDPSIRARGTFAGALCAAERQGDWAAAALALDAQLHIMSATGERIEDYGQWLAAGAVIPPGEMVTAVRLTAPPKGAVQGYRKVKHVAIGWSIASVAFVVAPEFARISVSGAPDRPCRLSAVERHLVSGEGSLKEALCVDFKRMTFQGDSYASAEYRRHRLTVLIERTVHEFHTVYGDR